MHKRTVGINCKTKQKICIEGRIHNIETHDNKTVWELLRVFINSIPKESIFTRKELLKNIYTVPYSPRFHKVTTVDTYRLALSKLDFVETVGNGKYKKLMNIPKSLTITKVNQTIIKLRTWKGWFMPLHELLGVEKEEL